MKWQQFLPLMVVLVAVVAMIWRSSGKKKAGGCGCKCGCTHEPEPAPKAGQAGR